MNKVMEQSMELIPCQCCSVLLLESLDSKEVSNGYLWLNSISIVIPHETSIVPSPVLVVLGCLWFPRELPSFSLLLWHPGGLCCL